MRFDFNSYFKDFDKEGRATACLVFTIETPDPEFRDHLMERIMKLLTKEPDKEEKQGVIGFQVEASPEDQSDQ